VQVLDWAAIAAENPSFQGDAGLHLTDSGRERLAFEVAALLGEAPTGKGGECLSTSFSDDSAGRPIPRTSPSSGSSTGQTTATTTTTVKPGGAATTTAPTVPQTTGAAAPTPAPTSPPTTPASTSPPTTAAPPPPPTPTDDAQG
jgi:hypothetical protein